MLVIGLVVAPVLALVGLRGDPTGAPFVLNALGLGLTVAGPLLVSRLLSEPNYDVILGWDPEHLPADWQAARDRWIALNWIRGALTWVAFALFLAASYAHSPDRSIAMTSVTQAVLDALEGCLRAR